MAFHIPNSFYSLKCHMACPRSFKYAQLTNLQDFKNANLTFQHFHLFLNLPSSEYCLRFEFVIKWKKVSNFSCFTNTCVCFPTSIHTLCVSWILFVFYANAWCWPFDWWDIDIDHWHGPYSPFPWELLVIVMPWLHKLTNLRSSSPYVKILFIS